MCVSHRKTGVLREKYRFFNLTKITVEILFGFVYNVYIRVPGRAFFRAGAYPKGANKRYVYC